MSTILGYVTSITTTIFSVGGSLIDFITESGNEICLIPIALMLVVTAIGCIRKLVKGV